MAVALVARHTDACNVPVFRYALERWPADPYDIIVFHEGALTDEQQKVIDDLEEKVINDEYYVRPVDLSGDVHEAVRKFYDNLKTKELPCVAVRYPDSYVDDPPAYTGPLSASDLDLLIDSPTRREIARRILQGDSVVWLLVQSGDAEKDAKAEKMLNKQLKELTKELELPDLEPADAQYMDEEAGPELRLAFSLLTVSRSDAGERLFLELLDASDPEIDEGDAGQSEADPETNEDDPEDAGDDPQTEENDQDKGEDDPKNDVDEPQPEAYAFFGRGRVLGPLAGEDLVPEVVADACYYLTGPCSCQIKVQNPGFDMLMHVDWDGVIYGEYTLAEALPRLTTAAAVVQDTLDLKKAVEGIDTSTPEPDAPVEQASEQPATPVSEQPAASESEQPAKAAKEVVAQSSGSSFLTYVVVAVTAGVVVVALGSLAIFGRQRLDGKGPA
jgi:hypothetical protein